MLDNTAETIDSREIIDRIDELTAQDDLTTEEVQELAALSALAGEAEGYAPDWKYGETLIHADYFTEYATELVRECGYIPANTPAWIHIDWERTADEMRVDYTEVDFAGQAYLIR